MMSTAARVSSPFSNDSLSRRWWTTGFAVVGLIALARLALHLLTANRYGIFRDELYYLACAEHLDWGYVDQPPLIAVIAWFSRAIFGSSLLGLRLLPAVAGAGLVVLTGYQAFQLGGKRYATGLSALGVALAAVFLIDGHILSMNVFEPLLWMGCASIVIRIVQTGNQRLWLWFGVLAGVGLQNKYSMAVFGFALVIALLLTPQRTALTQKWIWIAGLIAFLIFLPNLIWNVQHHWPFVELMRNIRESGRDVALSPWQYFSRQILMMNPVAFPLWLAGLVWLLVDREGRRYRILGWAYVIQLAVFIVLHGKDYYAAPAAPMLFAAGGVACEQWIARVHRFWLKPVIVLLLLVPTLPLLPLVAPILSVDQLVRYQEFLHFKPPVSEHSHARSPLPQYYSDELGWEEMVAEVARVYHGLPADIQAKTAIKGDNYGECGAVDFFGPKYGLPKSICTHQNYWYWGPRGYTGESIILLGEGRPENLPPRFEHVKKVGRVETPYALERFDIYYGKGFKYNIPDIWPDEKHWD